MKFSKNVNNKKWSPILIFLGDFLFFEKIQLIFDIENWLWKYDFGTFWGQFTKYSNFTWIKLIFEKKPCILGPIKQETQWHNWHYSIYTGWWTRANKTKSSWSSIRWWYRIWYGWASANGTFQIYGWIWGSRVIIFPSKIKKLNKDQQQH